MGEILLMGLRWVERLAEPRGRAGARRGNLGDGGGLSPASVSAARGIAAEGSSCCLGVVVPSVGDAMSCLRCHPLPHLRVVKATHSIFSSTGGGWSGLAVNASHGCLGTPLPCRSDPLKTLPNSLLGHL